MYLCAEVYHISHSEFLMWDEGDRQKAIAWEIRRRQACPSCGTRPEEWKAGKRLIKPDIHTCIGCKEVSKMNESIPDKLRSFTRAVLKRVG